MTGKKKPSQKSWWRRWREARSERIDALRKIADELDAFRGEMFDIAKGQRNDMDHLTTSMIECLHAFSSDLTKTFDIRLFEHRFLEAMDRGAKHIAETIAKAISSAICGQRDELCRFLDDNLTQIAKALQGAKPARRKK